MDIFKLIGIAVTATVITVMLKEYRPAVAVCAALAAGVVIFFAISESLGQVISSFEQLSEKTGLDTRYFYIITKITGTAYIVGYAAQLCRDSGQGGIAMKLETAGKVAILAMSIPIIEGFLQICIEILEMF